MNPISIRKEWSFQMPNAQEFDHLIKFCEIMAQSPFYCKLGAGGVMAIYMTAREHNLPLMACLNGGLHTFDGKVTFSAIMVNSLIINAGHSAKILELNEKLCTIRFKRGDKTHDPDYQPLIYTYTIEDARIAGYLNKTNWKTSPKDMLWARCLTGGAKKEMSDVMAGVLVAGELVGTEIDGSVNVVAPEISTPKVKEIEPAVPLPIGYEEFVSKHGLIVSEDGFINPKLEYLSLTAKTVDKPLQSIIISAMLQEKAFENRFNLWAKTQKKNSELSDKDNSE